MNSFSASKQPAFGLENGFRRVFPEFFAIAIAYEMIVLPVVISQGSQVIFFRQPEIICVVAIAFMLVGEDDEAVLAVVEGFEQALAFFTRTDFLQQSIQRTHHILNTGRAGQLFSSDPAPIGLRNIFWISLRIYFTQSTQRMQRPQSTTKNDKGSPLEPGASSRAAKR